MLTPLQCEAQETTMEEMTGSGFAVRVESPLGVSLGVLLSDMRVWMDHQGIHPIDFKSLSHQAGRSYFDIYFRHQQQAALFRDSFLSLAA
jgi:hypothetical protein